jgi:hypothetical protein
MSKNFVEVIVEREAAAAELRDKLAIDQAERLKPVELTEEQKRLALWERLGLFNAVRKLRQAGGAR